MQSVVYLDQNIEIEVGNNRKVLQILGNAVFKKFEPKFEDERSPPIIRGKSIIILINL